MDVFFNNSQDRFATAELELLLRMVLEVGLIHMKHDGEKVEIGVSFVDNGEIQRMNREYRGKDEVTDVLSFPQWDPDDEWGFLDGSEESIPLGDIVLSLERAAEQAAEYGHSFSREVGYLTAHSLLHLLGFDHQTEEDRVEMRKHEEAIMARCDLQREVP